VAPAFWVTAVVNLINLVVTWWLVFGGAGFAGLGVLALGSEARLRACVMPACCLR